MENSKHLPATLDSLSPFEVFFNFSDDYLVSNNGRIASIKSGKMKILKSCKRNGYCQIGLRLTPKIITKKYVHVIVSSFFHGEIPDGYQVDHINFDRADNRLENLRQIPKEENIRRKSHAGIMRTKSVWRNKSEEWKKNSAAAVRKKWEDPDFRKRHNEITSKILSELHNDKEFKTKLSNAIKERNTKYSSKPVDQFTLDSQFVKRWPSGKVASETLGIRATSICYCCKGKYKSAGGYIWRYA